jgi:hypothetical protein
MGTWTKKTCVGLQASLSCNFYGCSLQMNRDDLVSFASKTVVDFEEISGGRHRRVGHLPCAKQLMMQSISIKVCTVAVTLASRFDVEWHYVDGKFARYFKGDITTAVSDNLDHRMRLRSARCIW